MWRFFGAATAAAATLGAFVGPFGATDATAQPRCGVPYVIGPGDSLSQIALVIYGNSNAWPNIYEFGRNPLVIGTNPNNIAAGSQIQMPPCPGQATAQPPQTVPRPASITTPSVAAIGFVPKIDLLTGGDYAPFTDENAPGRGMITQLVEAALQASGLPNDVQIDFINDWGSHLHTLLPRGKYDFGFPWIQPSCDDVDALPEAMQIRCDYEWSQPIYTFTVALFAPKNDPSSPQSFEDLRGKTLCRPAGYYTFDLAEKGLRDGETFTLSQPTTVAECFNQLERGEVDFVTINRFTGESAVSRLGLQDFIEPVRTLVDPRSFHVVAYRDNGEAAFTWMRGFNEGLERIRANGVWDEIVNWHLERHRASLNR